MHTLILDDSEPVFHGLFLKLDLDPGIPSETDPDPGVGGGGGGKYK